MLNFRVFIQKSTYLLVGGLVFFSCLGEERDCNEKPDISDADQSLLASQIASIDQHIDTTYSNYAVVSDPSGVRVVVLQEGRGKFPDYCSSVNVDYAANILGEDDSFETAGGAIFVLSRGNLIKGWYYGLFNMKTMGEYLLFVPGELAYGSDPRENDNGDVIIPSNSNLRFRIRVNGLGGN